MHSTRGISLDDHWNGMVFCKQHDDTKKQSEQWRGMASHKSGSFSERSFCLIQKMHWWVIIIFILIGEIYDGLIGVYVSSIVFEVSKTISSQFIPFLRKHFERKKTRHKQRSTNKTKKREQKTTKTTIFCSDKNFWEGKNRLFCVLVLFYDQIFS